MEREKGGSCTEKTLVALPLWFLRPLKQFWFASLPEIPEFFTCFHSRIVFIELLKFCNFLDKKYKISEVRNSCCFVDTFVYLPLPNVKGDRESLLPGYFLSN